MLTLSTARLMSTDHLIAALEAEGTGPRIAELVRRLEAATDELAEQQPYTNALNGSDGGDEITLEDLRTIRGMLIGDVRTTAEVLAVLTKHELQDPAELALIMKCIDKLRNI